MNPQRLFVRKVVYLAAIALLLMVLVWLGQPATIGVGTEKGSAGGVLAQLRQKHHFSEAQLGEIDPASETIKLATLGLRGVAVQMLWEQSNTYKMKKDWTNLAATLQKIIHLEPHFSKVWYFQGWNLSYNVSVEFDDYRERYRWIIKGIEFLKQGIRYNRSDPLLYRDVGWFISQKIGRADESVQYRKLFKEDDEFHREDDFGPERLGEQRDNWLVGKQWYARAESLVDPHDPAKTIKKVTPVVFFAYKPMCQMNYSEALAKDGVFGERGHAAWKEAGEDWTRFGNLELPGMEKGMYVHLNDAEKLREDARDLVARLEAMQPGLRAEIRKERYATLTPAERRAYELPQERRTPADWEPIGRAERKLHVTHEDVAFRIGQKDPAKGAEALRIAKEARDKEVRLAEVESQRTIVNFRHWKDRARVEQTADALAARKALYDAEKAKEAQDMKLADEKYREGFQKWRLVLDKKEKDWPPDLKKQDFLGQELVQFIRDYRKLLENETPPKRLPKDFILQDVLDLHDKNTPVRD
jgi:hypothetical protein